MTERCRGSDVRLVRSHALGVEELVQIGTGEGDKEGGEKDGDDEESDVCVGAVLPGRPAEGLGLQEGEVRGGTVVLGHLVVHACVDNVRLQETS